MAGAAFGTGPALLAGAPKPKGPTVAKPKTLGATLTTGPQATFTPAPTVKPQVPPAPTSKPVTSGTTTQAPTSPLDSTYYQNMAANQLKVQGQINGLNATSQNDATALQNALAQLSYQQPRDQLAVEENANRRGALFSSVEGQQQGNLLNQYQTKQSAATQANAQRQAAIAAQIGQILQGSQIYGQGQYDDAVGRATKLAASNPATGQAQIPPAVPTPVLQARLAVAQAQNSQKAALAKAVAKAQQKGRSTFVMTGARSK